MRKIILVLLIFIILTVVFTFPAILHVQDKIIGDGEDSSLLMGWQYVAETQIEKGVFPFSWTNYWRYPVGIDFSISYDSVIFVSLGLFLYNFSRDPVLVYNLSVLTLVFLDGVFSYLFFRKLSKDSVLGILGSVIYGFSFFVLARLAGHMNLIFVGSFPFLLYSLIIFKEKKADTNAFLLLGLSIVLIFLSSLQYLLILISACIFILPLFIYVYPEVTISYLSLVIKNIFKTIATILCVLFIFLFFNAGHVRAFLQSNLFTLPSNSMLSLSPHLEYFFLPNSYTPLVISSFPFPRVQIGGIEGSLFLGFVEMVLFGYFLITKNNKKIKIFIFTTVLLLFVISLGCGHSFLPYCYLYNFWPFKGIAEMARFYVVLYLFFSIGVIQAIRKLSTYSKWFLPAIFIFIIFERIPSGFYLSDSPQNETFIKIVRNLNSNAVLDLPIINEWENTPQKTDYDLYSIFYQKPIVNGAFQWLGYTEKSESFINKLMYFECKTSPIITDIDITKTIMPALNENGIKTLVYHKQLKVTDQKSGWCNQAIDNINFFLYKSDLSIKKAYEDDQTVVYQLQ